MNEASEQIIARAEEDEEFRARLIADPKATIEAELGVTIPDGLTIRVVETQGDEVVLVLPPVAATGDELADEELAAVAGGIQMTYVWGDRDWGTGRPVSRLARRQTL